MTFNAIARERMAAAVGDGPISYGPASPANCFEAFEALPLICAAIGKEDLADMLPG